MSRGWLPLALLVVVGWGCARPVVPQALHHHDTVVVRAEERYRERVRLVPVVVEVPAEAVQVERLDTISELRTSHAHSRASISSGGVLYHDLHQLPLRDTQQVTVVDSHTERVRDSVVVQRIHEVVEVRAPMRRWQQLLLYSGVALWLVVGWRVVRLLRVG